MKVHAESPEEEVLLREMERKAKQQQAMKTPDEIIEQSRSAIALAHLSGVNVVFEPEVISALCDSHDKNIKLHLEISEQLETALAERDRLKAERDEQGRTACSLFDECKKLQAEVARLQGIIADHQTAIRR